MPLSRSEIKSSTQTKGFKIRSLDQMDERRARRRKREIVTITLGKFD